jgi:RIO-like serine/threonine protein kinase
MPAPTRVVFAQFWTDVQGAYRVALMGQDFQLLGAMLRLARRREAADVDALLIRSSGSRADVRASLRRLEAANLVEQLSEGRARLTLAGFAVAVAIRGQRGRAMGQAARRAA